MTSLAVGFGLGLFVGAQPGPVSLLCIRSVLRGALASGIAIGAGAAMIDLLYAGLGLAGAASLLEADALRLAFGADRRARARPDRRAHPVGGVPRAPRR